MSLLMARDIGVERGRTTILDGVDLDLAPGVVQAIIGPNGAGKSTLLLALLGLISRQRGRVEVDGWPLDRLEARARARLVAYVPQRSRLEARLTVAEVVAHGRFPHRGARPGLAAGDRVAIGRALTTVDLAGLADRPYASLSGGEQARVLIARALATEAPVILLDEPTASLDVGHALDLFACLRRLAEGGQAIGIVLHDLNQARAWTDRALLLAAGRAITEGPTAEVLSRHRIASIYGVVVEADAALAFHRPEQRA